MLPFTQDENTRKRALEYNSKFSYYYSARQKWAKRANEYEQVFLNDVDGTGTQYTTEELKKLKDRYGIPLSINILSAIISQVQAFLTSTQPSINVIPIGKSSKHSAYFWRELIKALTYLNKFPAKQEQAIQDMLVTFHGLLFVEPDNFYNENEFKLNIKCLPWRWVFFDPNSIERDYQDSEMQFVAYPVTKSRAKKLLAPYGVTDEILAYAQSPLEGDSSQFFQIAPTTPMFHKDKLIWYQEIFEKVSATIYILEDGTRTTKMPKGAFVDPDGNLQNFAGLSYKGTFIQRTLKLGNYILYTEVLPITKYPIFPYSHTHNRSPFGYGLVHQVVDVQHAANKCIALTIENAQRTGNEATAAPAGSISDLEKFTRDRSTPGGVVFYEARPDLPNAGAPIPLPAARLSNAWFTLFERLIKLIEYITGIFDLMQGNAENAPTTLGATQSLQNFGSQRPKMLARHLDYANQDLLEVAIEYIQAYSPRENILRYIDGTGAMVEIEQEASARLAQDEEGNNYAVPDENGQMTASFVRNEATKEVYAILGSIKEGQYRVRYESASNLPSTRAMAMEIMKVALSGVNEPNLRTVLMQSMLELADYPEVDKLLRDTDVVNRLTQQVEQMQGALKEAEQVIEKKNREVEHYILLAKEAQIGAEVEVAKNKVDFAVKDINDKLAEIDKTERKEKVFD